MTLSHNVPVFSWPFVMPCLLMQMARHTVDLDEEKASHKLLPGAAVLVRPKDFSYPEKQAWLRFK